MTQIVKCPTCSRDVPWNEDSKWRPFCSERCKLIDLGAWADETHRIPSDEPLPPGHGDDERHWES